MQKRITASSLGRDATHPDHAVQLLSISSQPPSSIVFVHLATPPSSSSIPLFVRVDASASIKIPDALPCYLICSESIQVSVRERQTQTMCDREMFDEIYGCGLTYARDARVSSCGSNIAELIKWPGHMVFAVIQCLMRDDEVTGL